MYVNLERLIALFVEKCMKRVQENTYKSRMFYPGNNKITSNVVFP